MADFECFFADNKVNCFSDHRTLVIVILGNIIRFCIVVNNGFRLFAKNIDIVVSHQLMDFHIRSI